MSSLIAWILRAIPFGTIIMYGALGETLTEKSGNLNLGVPGIMYLGGFAGFASAYYYEKLSANQMGAAITTRERTVISRNLGRRFMVMIESLFYMNRMGWRNDSNPEYPSG